MERRPRSAREAERGSSPPGKLGATGHVRRDRSTPGSGGSVPTTKGCSAGFGGGKSAKSPKGCGPFAPGRPVRGCTPAGVARRRRLRANPSWVVLPRRAAGGVLLEGKRSANARGSLAPRGARGRRRARTRRAWMCPYAVVSFAEVDRRLGPREALPPHATASKGHVGGRGERGLGPRMYNRACPSRQPMARATCEAPRCVDQACRGEPRATKSREPERALVATTVRAGPKKTPRSDPHGGNLGTKGAQSPAERPEQEQRSSCRWKAPRAGKSLAVSRRQGGSGLGGPRRVGEHTRYREKSAHRYRAGVATGASEARSPTRVGGRERPHVARAVRRSDAERRETLSSPVSMGGIPSSPRPTKSR